MGTLPISAPTITNFKLTTVLPNQVEFHTILRIFICRKFVEFGIGFFFVKSKALLLIDVDVPSRFWIGDNDN